MKNIKRIFREAERLQPSEELWQRIESDVTLKGSIPKAGFVPKAGPTRGWFMPTPTSPIFKMAASVALVAGLSSMGLFLQHRAVNRGAVSKGMGNTQVAMTSFADHSTTGAGAKAADGAVGGNGPAKSTAYVVDPDLVDWAADLGELNLEADDSAEDAL